MSWSDAQGKSGGAPQNSSHMSIKPNQTVKIHVLLNEGEEPRSYWTHFIRCADGRSRSVICPGRDVCPGCIKGTVKSRKRHAVNVWSYDDNAVKILETGNSVMQQMKLIYDQFGSLNEVDLAIRRTGSGLDTAYTVTAMQLATPFEWGNKELYDIDILKSPDSAEKINAYLSGGTAPIAGAPTPVPRQPQESTDAPSPNTTIPSLKVDFGKYKGMTMAEIAEKDMNYVKWCAENIEDFAIKAEAQKLARGAGTQAKSATASPSPSAPPPPNERTGLMAEVQLVINEKYASDFPALLEKMKQATASPARPSGKTLLIDYTVEELKKLKEVIK